MYLNILRHTPRLRAIDLNWTLKKKLVWGYRPGWNRMETTQAVNSFRNHIDIPFPKVKRLNTPRYSHPRNHFSCRVFPSSTSLTSPGSGCILLSRVDWYFQNERFPIPRPLSRGDGALHCNSTTRLWDRMSPAAQLCRKLLPSEYFKVTWHRLA